MLFLGVSVWLLVPVAIVVLGLRTVWVSVTLPRKVPREAACGRCAYPVAGLASPTCPECGSDFRVVGISTPRFVMRWRGGYAGAIIGWTLSMVMIGAVSAWFITIFAFSSTMMTSSGSWSTGLTQKLTPNSGSVRSYDFSSDQSWTSAGSMTQTITIVAHLNDGSQDTFTLDHGAGTFTTGDGTAQPAAFKGNSVTGWMQSLGLDTTNSVIAAEAQDLTRMVDVASVSPGDSVSNLVQSSFSVGFPQWNNTSVPTAAASGIGNLAVIGYSVAGVLFLLWVGGIIWICLRRAKLLAAGT